MKRFPLTSILPRDQNFVTQTQTLFDTLAYLAQYFQLLEDTQPYTLKAGIILPYSNLYCYTGYHCPLTRLLENVGYQN